MTIPIIDAKDEKKFRIRYIVQEFEERISQSEGVNLGLKPISSDVGFAADALVVGLIAYPQSGGMGQTVTIQGRRADGKAVDVRDLFTFWMNLALQLSRHPELDDTRRALAAQCAQELIRFFMEAAPPTPAIISKA